MASFPATVTRCDASSDVAVLEAVFDGDRFEPLTFVSDLYKDGEPFQAYGYQRHLISLEFTGEQI